MKKVLGIALISLAISACSTNPFSSEDDKNNVGADDENNPCAEGYIYSIEYGVDANNFKTTKEVCNPDPSYLYDCLSNIYHRECYWGEVHDSVDSQLTENAHGGPITSEWRACIHEYVCYELYAQKYNKQNTRQCQY